MSQSDTGDGLESQEQISGSDKVDLPAPVLSFPERSDETDTWG